ncbi:MAG: helix-turn-helix transcriptional regulator [Coriobacteriia bacterium]
MRNLTRERERQKLSRSALARLAEMNQATVSQIESGYIGKAYASQLLKLSDALAPGGWTGKPEALLDEVHSDD